MARARRAGIELGMIGVPLRMARENLDGIPQFGVPPGFGLRWYEPGDEKFWLRIHLRGEKLNRVTPELFEQQFAGNIEALRTRQCYVLNADGERVGTGTAWFNDN